MGGAGVGDLAEQREAVDERRGGTSSVARLHAAAADSASCSLRWHRASRPWATRRRRRAVGRRPRRHRKPPRRLRRRPRRRRRGRSSPTGSAAPASAAFASSAAERSAAGSGRPTRRSPSSPAASAVSSVHGTSAAGSSSRTSIIDRTLPSVPSPSASRSLSNSAIARFSSTPARAGWWGGSRSSSTSVATRQASGRPSACSERIIRWTQPADGPGSWTSSSSSASAAKKASAGRRSRLSSSARRRASACRVADPRPPHRRDRDAAEGNPWGEGADQRRAEEGEGEREADRGQRQRPPRRRHRVGLRLVEPLLQRVGVGQVFGCGFSSAGKLSHPRRTAGPIPRGKDKPMPIHLIYARSEDFCIGRGGGLPSPSR